MRVTARRLTVRKAIMMFSPIAVLAVSFTLSAQTDETLTFPKEFPRWAHVKSVLVGPQSIAFATEGASITFTQTVRRLRVMTLGNSRMVQ
jgi:hypothetical protein